jgi:cell division septal protein FtsQ
MDKTSTQRTHSRRHHRRSTRFHRHLRWWLLVFALLTFIILGFYIFNHMSHVRITGETG